MTTTVVSQVKLVVGKQEVTCDCGKTMTVTVSRATGSARTGKKYPYRGSCRGCGAIYSGAKRAHIW